jgi:predicted dehydrogenase
LDSLCWWCGDIESLSAELAVFMPARRLGDGMEVQSITADDAAALLLRFRSGALATLQTSIVGGHPFREARVYGSAGTALIRDDGPLLFGQLGEGLHEETATPASGSEARRELRIDALAALVTDVREHIEARQDGRVLAQGVRHPTFFDGLRVQELLDRAYALSYTTRRAPRLPAGVAVAENAGQRPT